MSTTLPVAALTQARDYLDAAKSDATKKAYRVDMAHFGSWCASYGVAALPALPETIALYLSMHGKTHKVATLLRRLSSISMAHKLSGLPFDSKHSAIATMIAGIKRTEGTAQVQKAALTTDVVADVLPTGDRLIDVRDRSVLLLGLALGARRSEIANLQVGDIVIRRTHAEVTIRFSKTDQEGRGEVIAVSYTANATCPVAALEDWLVRASITDGFLFRSISKGGLIGARLSDRAMAEIVKKCAAQAGLDAAQYSGHSLRSGFVTSAAMHGLHTDEIKRHTRHKSSVMVERYVQKGRLGRSRITEQIGL